MSTLIQDERLASRVIAERRRLGLDGPDEVWDGTYVIMPNPNDEHQEIVGELITNLTLTIQHPGLGKVRPGVNISDRVADWTENFRCPDVAVFLNDSVAECHDAFWFGGPDFGIEIVSPHDRTREKLDFYAVVNTRELLIIEREPWSLELFRLQSGELRPVGRSTPDDPQALTSGVLPLTWRLVAAAPRPHIELSHSDGRVWTI
jgi:Uma2 family endonuclease